MPVTINNPDLRVIYEAIIAGVPTGGGATETTLLQVLSACEAIDAGVDITNDQLDTANETLIGIRTNTQTTADNTFSTDQGLSVADIAVETNVILEKNAKGYTAPDDPAFVRYFVSTGSADLEDEVDEVMFDMNAELALITGNGSDSAFNSANMAIVTYEVAAVVNFRVVIWVSFVI